MGSAEGPDGTNRGRCGYIPVPGGGSIGGGDIGGGDIAAAAGCTRWDVYGPCGDDG